MQRAGLYIHVPFCSAICPYCDFAVVRDRATGRSARHRAWIDALRLEIVETQRAAALPAGSLPFETVYFGGGTPSALEPDELAEVLELLREGLPVDDDAVLHLEANPEDVTGARAAAWRRSGVRFLSLGVQALDRRDLGFLGRRHGPGDALEAYETCRSVGIETVSLDVIFALPGQSPSGWRKSLETLIALEPSHLSLYELEIHERTSFGKRARRGELQPADEDTQAQLLLGTHEVLAAAGIDAYEVSNFAADAEHRSRHNQKYWTQAPYVGLGPSAHSYDGLCHRWWNHRHVARWQRSLREGHGAREAEERLSPEDLVLESLMLSLRTVRGLDLAALRARTGFDLLDEKVDVVQRLIDDGLLRAPKDGRLRPTVRGMATADRLALELAADN